MSTDYSDRSSELLKCANLLHQRVITGRSKLKPRVSSSNSTLRLFESTMFHTQFLPVMKQTAANLTLSQSNYKQLIFLSEEYNSADQNQRQHLATEISVLAKKLQSEVLKINTLLQHTLKLSPNVVRELSDHPQMCRHIKALISNSEYRLADLSMHLRDFFKNKQGILDFEDSKHRDREEEGPPVLPLINEGLLFYPANRSGSHSNELSQPLSSVTSRSISASSTATRTQYERPQIQEHRPNFYTQQQYPHPRQMPTTNSSRVIPITEKLRDEEPFAYQGQRQQSIMAQSVVRQRDSTAAIRSTEATIVQLGEIYQQFSFLVKEQGELVTRIDTNLDEAGVNVDLAHGELGQFLRSISSRRGFMIKVFAVLIVCFFLFSLFVR